MILETTYIDRDNGNKYYLNKNLNCKNYGIYGAKCRICYQYYIGQTKTSFSQRWNSHRHIWRKMLKNYKTNEGVNKKEETKDDQALFIHFTKYHKDLIKDHFEISDAYQVVFIEQPSYKKLDIQENFWIGKLRATINIARTYLPKYK